jgi:hypothetical protein
MYFEEFELANKIQIVLKFLYYYVNIDNYF